jgi:phage tail-like protein
MMRRPDIPNVFDQGDPHLAFRFSVVFFSLGVIPNLIDTLFQKVSGLGATVDTIPINEGGQNLYTQHLPTRIQHQNLTLERGLITPSPLTIEINASVLLFKFKPANVLVSLLNDSGEAVFSWMFLNAFPVSWRVSELNADTNQVVIESIELKYQNMLVIPV